MIRAGPDDPGGGPDELEARLVAVQQGRAEARVTAAAMAAT